MCVQCGWFAAVPFVSAGDVISVRSEGGGEGQMWAVLYDDGMSLTTASELIARSLAEAERQRGRRVTIQCLDDVETHPRGADSVPEPEPIRPVERFARPEPISEPAPAPAPEPAQAVEPVQAVE